LPALIAEAERALAGAKNFDEVKAIRDEMSGLQALAQKLGADSRKFSEIKLRAEIRLGEELAKIKKAKGAREPGTNRGTTRSPAATASPTLAAVGVSKTQSSRWQQAAAITAQAREAYYREATEISTSGCLRLGQQQFKAARRAEREQELAERTKAAARALGREVFSVLYVDPPTDWVPWSRETGSDRGACNHYPLMSFEALSKLVLPAAADAALFQWTSPPMLEQALALMRAWGFEYRSHCTWDKARPGLGFWWRIQHELLLLGVRGNVPAPAPGTQWPSVIRAPVGRHSAKPEVFARMIEEYFPNASRIELFARRPRAGWTVWGNEVVEADSGDRSANAMPT
jgi:N6-adenosine-specific RNA methylase IME4